VPPIRTIAGFNLTFPANPTLRLERDAAGVADAE
jgi:hypothetical protein